MECLTDEILLMIFKHLYTDEIAVISQVNKRFHNVARDASLYRYSLSKYIVFIAVTTDIGQNMILTIYLLLKISVQDRGYKVLQRLSDTFNTSAVLNCLPDHFCNYFKYGKNGLIIRDL